MDTIKKFDDVCEIHVVLQDDVTVDLHQRQRDEQDIVGGRHVFGCPDGLPNREDIIIDEFCRDTNTHTQGKGQSLSSRCCPPSGKIPGQPWSALLSWSSGQSSGQETGDLDAVI